MILSNSKGERTQSGIELYFVILVQTKFPIISDCKCLGYRIKNHIKNSENDWRFEKLRQI